MRTLYKITAATFLAAVLFSCTLKKVITVNFLGEVASRRTFADIQFITNEKERDKYIADQEKSNPELMYYSAAADSILVAGFERLGVVQNNEFLQASFKSQSDERTNFIDRSNHNFPIKFYNDTVTGTTHFKIFFSKDSIDIDTQAINLQNLDYAFLDVIPGGNKELVFLDDYYIMNGYNFNLKVYEIKSQ